MFGSLWRQRYLSLDGQMGRPTLAECVDIALKQRQSCEKDDLVDYIEDFLCYMAGRYTNEN